MAKVKNDDRYMKKSLLKTETFTDSCQRIPSDYKTYYFGILFIKKTTKLSYQKALLISVVKKWYLFGFIKFKTETKS